MLSPILVSDNLFTINSILKISFFFHSYNAALFTVTDDREIRPNTPISDQVSIFEWKYYHIGVQSNVGGLTFIVNQVRHDLCVCVFFFL